MWFEFEDELNQTRLVGSQGTQNALKFSLKNTATRIINPVELLTTRSNIIFLKSINLVITISFVGSTVDKIFDVCGLLRMTQYLSNEEYSIQICALFLYLGHAVFIFHQFGLNWRKACNYNTKNYAFSFQFTNCIVAICVVNINCSL